MLLSTEFLFIWRNGSTDEKIIIINANRHYVLEDLGDDRVCSNNIRMSFDPIKNVITVKKD